MKYSALLPLVFLSQQSLATPVLWTGNGSYYDVIFGQITWDQANTQANGYSWEGETGHLATITSQAESDFIFSSLAVQDDHYWLGGYQSDTSGLNNEGWEWVTGEQWSYENWFSGEPNNYNGNEDTLMFQGVRGGSWNDGDGVSGSVGYIIEYSLSQVPNAPAPAPAPAPVAVPEPQVYQLLLTLFILVGYLRRKYS